MNNKPERPQRRWERHVYDKHIEFVLSPDQRWSGTTRDVSLNGVFLETPIAPGSVTEGVTGELHVQTHNGADIFACKVVRIAPNGLALLILDKTARFGLLLTEEIFAGLKSTHKPFTPARRRAKT